MLKKSLWVIIPLLIIGIGQAAIEYGLNKKVNKYTMEIQASQTFPKSITCTNKHFSWIPFAPEMSCDVTASGPIIAAGRKTGDVILKSRQISLKPDIFSKAMTLTFTHDINFQIPTPDGSASPMKINLTNLKIKAGNKLGIYIEGSDITALDVSTKDKNTNSKFMFAVHKLKITARQDKKEDSLSASFTLDSPVLSSELLKHTYQKHAVQVRLPSIESDFIAHGVSSYMHYTPSDTNHKSDFNIRKLTLSYPPLDAPKTKKRIWASITVQGKEDQKATLKIPGLMPIAVKGYYYSPDFKVLADIMHQQQILTDDFYMGLLSFLSATSIDVTKAVHSSEKAMGASFSIASGQIKINDKLIWDRRAQMPLLRPTH